jgi:hypothetical protein
MNKKIELKNNLQNCLSKIKDQYILLNEYNKIINNFDINMKKQNLLKVKYSNVYKDISTYSNEELLRKKDLIIKKYSNK